MNKCGHDDCSTCPYTDCDPKFWPNRKKYYNKAQKQAYYRANKDRIKAVHNEWRKNNPEKLAEYVNKQRERRALLRKELQNE